MTTEVNVDVSISGRAPALIVTVGTRAFAIPVCHVTETMRPLPIEPVAGTPGFIRGISMIRGAPVPVVDLAMLLESSDPRKVYGRFVTLKVEERRVALAVDGVAGLRSLDLAQLKGLPPLLRDADFIEAIGASDAQLLVVLRAARIVPDEVWATLATGTEAR